MPATKRKTKPAPPHRTTGLMALRELALVGLRDNEDVRGPWKAARHREGPEWMFYGPELVSRPGRTVVGAVGLDVPTNDEAEGYCRATAEYMVMASNVAPYLYEACRKAMTCASLPDAVKDVLQVALAKADGWTAAWEK